MAPGEIETLLNEIQSGNRMSLARAITLIESQSAEHRSGALEILDGIVPSNHDSFRFAISGPPGVGKSMLIESLGLRLCNSGKKLAVLSIDPTSQISRGSILGDKTRMTELSNHPLAFVRPTAAGSALGGTAERTREAISLCEAAGYEYICIETVGVGQSETEAHAMVDCFVLVVSPAGGDTVQGIKRGIMEMADLVVINKADGVLIEAANSTQRDYARALHLFQKKKHGLQISVHICSALTGNGIEQLHLLLEDFKSKIENNDYKTKNRATQKHNWLRASFIRIANEIILSSPDIRDTFERVIQKVKDGEMSEGKAMVIIQELVRNSIHI